MQDITTLEQFNLAQWLAYIQQIHPSLMDLSLDRLRKIAKLLACTQFNCPVVTVAGTNGKGSFVAAMEAVSAGKLKVGSFTSPHLIAFNERIKLNGQAVDDSLICAAFYQIEQLRQELLLSGEELSLTYFEFATLAALLIFKQAEVDLIVLEVGLGGRLDATNIVDANIAVVTTISFDHMHILGDTLDKIAYEKAGIFKLGCYAVVGKKALFPSLLDYAVKQQVVLHKEGEQFSWQGNTWCSGKLKLELGNLSLARDSVALALQVCKLLQENYQITFSQQELEEKLSKATLMGRLQHVFHKVEHILDVSHNQEGVARLANYLRELKARQHVGKIYAIWSSLRDKQHAAMLINLQDLVDVWLLCEVDSLRKSSKEELLAVLSASIPTKAATTLLFSNFREAHAKVLQLVSKQDLVVVFGGFNLVEQALLRFNELQAEDNRV